MMRGGPPLGYGPRGYDPRGGYGVRDYRREYEHQYRHSEPSPWVPATILGVIMLITCMPYMRTPELPIAYQAVARTTSSFPLPVLWIPVLAFLALQYFGGNWYHGYGDGEGYVRYGMRGGPSGMYAGRGGYAGGAYGGASDAYRSRGIGPYRMALEDNRAWGGWWPWFSASWNGYNRYNNYQQRGLISTFMDYGGHWFLILLGIAVFTLVGSSSLPLPPPPAILPVPPLAPQTLGFPWSLFF